MLKRNEKIFQRFVANLDGGFDLGEAVLKGVSVEDAREWERFGNEAREFKKWVTEREGEYFVSNSYEAGLPKSILIGYHFRREGALSSREIETELARRNLPFEPAESYIR